MLLSPSGSAIFFVMKTMQLSIRRCPPKVHQALRTSAQANRRSLNAEALIWLENHTENEKPVTGAQWAQRLRKARKMLTEKEHTEFAKNVTEARQRMRHERLH
jgi:hypothetical protein